MAIPGARLEEEANETRWLERVVVGEAVSIGHQSVTSCVDCRARPTRAADQSPRTGGAWLARCMP